MRLKKAYPDAKLGILHGNAKHRTSGAVNNDIRTIFTPTDGLPVPIAICMSGVGSNAEVLLRKAAADPGAGFRVAVIFTDAPESSAAAALGAKYHGRM